MMPKLKVGTALLIAERDRTPECDSCDAMAEEGKTYCRYCKDYWENDAPLLQEIADESFWEMDIDQ